MMVVVRILLVPVVGEMMKEMGVGLQKWKIWKFGWILQMTYCIWYILEVRMELATCPCLLFIVVTVVSIFLICYYYILCVTRFSLSWTTSIFVEVLWSAGSGDQQVLMKISGGV